MKALINRIRQREIEMDGAPKGVTLQGIQLTAEHLGLLWVSAMDQNGVEDQEKHMANVMACLAVSAHRLGLNPDRIRDGALKIIDDLQMVPVPGSETLKKIPVK